MERNETVGARSPEASRKDIRVVLCMVVDCCGRGEGVKRFSGWPFWGGRKLWTFIVRMMSGKGVHQRRDVSSEYNPAEAGYSQIINLQEIEMSSKGESEV